jgi:hypothetical protein
MRNPVVMARSWLLPVLICAYPAVAQTDSMETSLQFLKSTEPMRYPAIDLGLVDPVKRQDAERLYNAQMKALWQIVGTKDTSLIPLLIPYLNYCIPVTSSIPVGSVFTPPQLDLTTLCSRWPVISVIVRMPNSATALIDYALDRKNSINYRLTALEVLWYLDQAKFQTAANSWDQEYSKPGTHKLNGLRAIEDGSFRFRGIVEAFPDDYRE